MILCQHLLVLILLPLLSIVSVVATGTTNDSPDSPIPEVDDQVHLHNANDNTNDHADYFNYASASTFVKSVAAAGVVSAKEQLDKIEYRKLFLQSKDATAELASMTMKLGKEGAALVAEQAPTMEQSSQWINDHPKTSTALGVGAILVGGTVALPGAVSALGFTSVGIQAGTLAHAIQAPAYGGFTSGAFSMLQSFGATHTPTVVSNVFGTVFVGGGITGLSWGSSSGTGKDDCSGAGEKEKENENEVKEHKGQACEAREEEKKKF